MLLPVRLKETQQVTEDIHINPISGSLKKLREYGHAIEASPHARTVPARLHLRKAKGRSKEEALLL